MAGIDLIKQDLLNQFMTVRGSRVMRPEYGSIIHELIFEPLDEFTISDIQDDVQRIINSEPRVSFINMDVTESDHGVKVEILLNFLSEYTTDQLVLFYTRNNNDVS
jgi:phage baseplate assembly protein W